METPQQETIMSTRPARRGSVKDSIKKILPRPKGKYVPLPVGGYPLPDIIKRRFALPPQLPDINRLSLISDFTSSLYGEKWSEAIQQSLMEQQPPRTRVPESSDRLRVRYSIVPDEPTTTTPHQIPCRIYEAPSRPRTLRRVRGQRNLASFRERSIGSPTLSETFAMARTATFARAHRRRDSGSEATLVGDESGAEDLKGEVRPSLNANMDSLAAAIYSPEAEDSSNDVRPVLNANIDSIAAAIFSPEAQDSVSAARPFSGASLGSIETAVYNPMKYAGVKDSISVSRPLSEASLDSVATAIFDPVNDLRFADWTSGARPVSETSLDSVETAIYIPPAPKPDRKSTCTVTDSVPNLLTSFCILDLQIPRSPIRVTTQDLIPQEKTADGEAFFVDNADLDNPWEIKTTDSGDNKTHQIIVQGDLIDSSGALPSGSHRFTGQLDVTNLINLLELEQDSDTADDDYDVWLDLAHEEMDRLGIHRTIRDGSSQQNRSSTSLSTKQKEKALQILRDLHNDYFIIGPSGPQKTGDYQITHLSPSLWHSMSPAKSNNPLQSLFDVETLRGSLDKGERFVVRAVAEGEGTEKRLYCLPMFGPALTCWLCFLVDGGLDCFWYG